MRGIPLGSLLQPWQNCASMVPVAADHLHDKGGAAARLPVLSMYDASRPSSILVNSKFSGAVLPDAGVTGVKLIRFSYPGSFGRTPPAGQRRNTAFAKQEH